MRHHTAAARRSRKLPTDAERRLWAQLRRLQLGVAFRRQHPVAGYIVDFYAPAVKFAIELDGGQHDTVALRDRMRTQALTARGITVLRFWNNEVLSDMEGVVRAIRTVLAWLAPRTPSLSLGAGERSTGPFAFPPQALSGGGDARGAVPLDPLRLDIGQSDA